MLPPIRLAYANTLRTLFCRKNTMQSRSNITPWLSRTMTPAWSSSVPGLTASFASWMTKPASLRHRYAGFSTWVPLLTFLAIFSHWCVSTACGLVTMLPCCFCQSSCVQLIDLFAQFFPRPQTIPSCRNAIITMEETHFTPNQRFHCPLSQYTTMQGLLPTRSASHLLAFKHILWLLGVQFQYIQIKCLPAFQGTQFPEQESWPLSSRGSWAFCTESTEGKSQKAGQYENINYN